MATKTTLKVLGAAVAFAIAGQVSAVEGNRYLLDRYYASEISVSEAYLAMEHSKDFSNLPGEPKPVLIDVRTLGEYAAGHPEDAYNVPYPRIQGSTQQTYRKLYDEVYSIVGGRMDTPIMTLCRTGQRSVLAGNILANPEKYLPSQGLQPFTNVRNIWQGFVGQPLYGFDGGNIELDINNDGTIDGPYVLDLNNNDQIDVDYADVYTEVKDANPDKDGWRNFAELPWTTQIQKPLAYERDPGLYKALKLTPVP